MKAFVPIRQVERPRHSGTAGTDTIAWNAGDDRTLLDPRTAAMLQLAEKIVDHWRESGGLESDITTNVVPEVREAFTDAVRADNAARAADTERQPRITAHVPASL